MSVVPHIPRILYLFLECYKELYTPLSPPSVRAPDFCWGIICKWFILSAECTLVPKVLKMICFNRVTSNKWAAQPSTLTSSIGVHHLSWLVLSCLVVSAPVYWRMLFHNHPIFPTHPTADWRIVLSLTNFWIVDAANHFVLIRRDLQGFFCLIRSLSQKYSLYFSPNKV